MRDLFGNILQSKPVRVNIYADEIQPVEDETTKEKWFYIGIIAEDLDNPLLDDIIKIRYCNNFDKTSPYYSKNNRKIHWSEIADIDTKNIASRWIDYILNENKDKFYAYVLGINDSKLNSEDFDPTNEFNSKYNRFFRSAILYGLKCFFGNREIIVENIFHEEGQQKDHHYFPWHCIYKIQEQEENISFEVNNIIFLPKDHRKDKRSNIIQLCDMLLGLCKTIIHGIEGSNKVSQYKKELLDKFFPLLKRMVQDPYNKNSSYAHFNRIMIRFFPKHRTTPDNLKRFDNQFFTQRKLIYEEQMLGQLSLKY